MSPHGVNAADPAQGPRREIGVPWVAAERLPAIANLLAPNLIRQPMRTSDELRAWNAKSRRLLSGVSRLRTDCPVDKQAYCSTTWLLLLLLPGLLVLLLLPWSTS
jgi:hypothetical protein